MATVRQIQLRKLLNPGILSLFILTLAKFASPTEARMNEAAMKFNSKLLLATLYMRYFGLRKIPVLFFVGPRISEWDEHKVSIKIPLNYRTKNHLGSMYFGVLAAGADLAAGFVAMEEIRNSGQKISLIFKDMKADFLKRAEGDVVFTCTQVEEVKELVSKAVATGDRVELPVLVTATVPKKLGDEAVATFVLTLSLKKKEPKDQKEPQGKAHSQQHKSKGEKYA